MVIGKRRSMIADAFSAVLTWVFLAQVGDCLAMRSGPAVIALASGFPADHFVGYAFAVVAVDAFTRVDDDVASVSGPSFGTCASDAAANHFVRHALAVAAVDTSDFTRVDYDVASLSGPSFGTGASGASANHSVRHAFAFAAVETLTRIDDNVASASGPSSVAGARGFGTVGDTFPIPALDAGTWISFLLADVPQPYVATSVIPSSVSRHLLQAVFVSKEVIGHLFAPVTLHPLSVDPFEGSPSFSADPPSVIPQRKNRGFSEESESDVGFDRVGFDVLADEPVSGA